MDLNLNSENSSAILNTILADINALIPNLASLVDSYRLLVGAAAEVRQTPDTPFEYFQRAAIRHDRAGALIDTLLELLCCKITFSSQFLSITCAPVDLMEQLPNREDKVITSHERAIEIFLMETARRLSENIHEHGSCFGPPPPISPSPKNNLPPAQSPDSVPGKELADEVFEALEQEVIAELDTEKYFRRAKPKNKFTSPLSRRHI